MSYDVIVVGGSYAGMAAALQVARARRRVLVIDAGLRRNRFASHSHGFLGQDGRDPADIARQARDQLMAYPSVIWMVATAARAEREVDDFAVTLEDGSRQTAKRLVLAPGVRDSLLDVPGLQDRWGRSVFHCPYCHGYELDGPLGVVATGPASLHQALLLPDWGPTTLFLNGAVTPEAGQRAQLKARGVTVEQAGIDGIDGHADVRLEDGREVPLAGLFVLPRVRPNSPLVEDLGCTTDDSPIGTYIHTDGFKETSVSGVFACGDAARASHSVSFAVGDGALAGQSVHRSLVFD